MEDKIKYLKIEFDEAIDVFDKFRKDYENLRGIVDTADKISSILGNGNGLMICGNGGSASDASHMTGELVGRYKNSERHGLNVITLGTDLAVTTAVSNDYDFNDLYAREVVARGKNGDGLIGISTSGNSENIVRAFEKAKEMNVTTISLTGNDGGTLYGLSDYNINVSCNNTPRIQEVHGKIIHDLCDLIEKEMFGGFE